MLPFKINALNAPSSSERLTDELEAREVDGEDGVGVFEFEFESAVDGASLLNARGVASRLAREDGEGELPRGKGR